MQRVAPQCEQLSHTVLQRHYIVSGAIGENASTIL